MKSPSRIKFTIIALITATIAIATAATATAATAPAETILDLDFTKGAHRWTGNAKIADLGVTPQGLAFRSTGLDPWIEGPPADFPPGRRVRLTLRLKTDADASAELFHGPSFSAENSHRFSVIPDGKMHDYTFILPALGPKTRFRLDPALDTGNFILASLRADVLPPAPQPPKLNPPRRPQKGAAKGHVIKSGLLELEHFDEHWGGFVIRYDGVELASGHQNEILGFMQDDKVQWVEMKNNIFPLLSKNGGNIICRTTLALPGGNRAVLQRTFNPGQKPGTIDVIVTLNAEKDVECFHLPWLTLLPGLETYGAKKRQALFAGIEYLADEPSSSEADLKPPHSNRRIPNPVDPTFPLMALQHDGKYLGLTWEPSALVAPLFDSPDRTYNSGGHLMGLLAPGVGDLRLENQLYSWQPFTIKANQPLSFKARIIAGDGTSVVDAVKHYVKLQAAVYGGLPPLPEFPGGFDAAVNLLAHGWLDSQIQEDGLWRHAVWQGFPASPAAEPSVYLRWLVNHTTDAALQQRLRNADARGLERLPVNAPYLSRVSHVVKPTPPLVLGRTEAYLNARLNQARGALRRFDENGLVHYRQAEGKPDFARTHWTDHANGITGLVVADILNTVLLTGDPELEREGLRRLDQLSVYDLTVPRGAQTWEIPLHTPDIMASAHMVRAYVAGYELTGKKEYLDRAVYWAWTGLPFIYLHNPTSGKTGPYSTAAVLGATSWVAPVWIGQPVQWCGLVYGAALHQLAPHDDSAPWAHIANGITATGLQMTFPLSDQNRQGLLPDFFHLQAQRSDGPAINPGTVQTHLPELYGKGKIYDFKKAPKSGWLIHAPCAITNLEETSESVRFRVDGFGAEPYNILIARIPAKPKSITTQTAASAPQQVDYKYNPARQWLILPAQNPTTLHIQP